jgi:hypothetical protein
VDYRSVHIVLGFALAFILVGRLGWRICRGLTTPADRYRLLAATAKTMHWVWDLCTETSLRASAQAAETPIMPSPMTTTSACRGMACRGVTASTVGTGQ